MIILTGNEIGNDHGQYIEAGMDDCLSDTTVKTLRKMSMRWPHADHVAKQYKSHCEGEKMTEEKISSESKYPIFDKEAFLGRIGRNEALAQKILVKFIDDIPKRMETIRGAMEKRDIEEIRIQAHTIKGSSRNIGAERLGYYAELLEKSSSSGDFVLIEGSVTDVQSGFEEFRSVIMP